LDDPDWAKSISPVTPRESFIIEDGVENKAEGSSPKDLLGVSTAKDMSCEVDAQEGASAFRTLLFGKMFSLPAATPLPLFLFPVKYPLSF
jgi:hypothetical protein